MMSGALLLHTDLFIHASWLAFAAVASFVVGQSIARPHTAVLLGLLYPRSDRRLDLGYLAFYIFLNLSGMLGPLIGAAMFKQYG